MRSLCSVVAPYRTARGKSRHDQRMFSNADLSRGDDIEEKETSVNEE